MRFVSAQGTLPGIVSYRVDGAPNYDAPGSEVFWNNIGATTVPLAASVSPGGGQTANVLVKSANDGYNVYVLLQWHDDQGPSFGSSSEVYQAPNGTLLPLDPASTSSVRQLFYNSTYYYPDRAAVLWFLPSASNRQQSPVMQLGSNGAITGGAADIWHWQSNPTDNNPDDAAFPGGYTDPSGNPIFPSDKLSFAEDDYTNTTGFFVIAGSFGQGSPNLVPYADPTWFMLEISSLRRIRPGRLKWSGLSILRTRRDTECSLQTGRTISLPSLFGTEGLESLHISNLSHNGTT